MPERFASSATERLPLSGGDWIDVKLELSAGDERKMNAYAVTNVRREHGVVLYDLDAEKLPVARTIAYLVDWSFRDREGRPVPVSASAIAALSTAAAEEIDEAILKHEQAVQEKQKVDHEFLCALARQDFGIVRALRGGLTLSELRALPAWEYDELVDYLREVAAERDTD